MATRKTVADTLKKATVGYFAKLRFSSFLEVGLESWGRIRADVVSLNLRGHLIICEVKSCKADFNTDTKWHRYLEYSNQFYFVCTESIAEHIKANIPSSVGILCLSPKTGFLYSYKSAKKQKVPGPNRRNIITRCAWRGGLSRRNTRRTRQFLE